MMLGMQRAAEAAEGWHGDEGDELSIGNSVENPQSVGRGRGEGLDGGLGLRWLADWLAELVG